MSIFMKDFPNREAWLAARKENGIGASEVATVCGVDRWKSALELWEERTGRAKPTDTNEAMERGHQREPVIRERFMREWGWLFDLQYNEFGMWINTDYPHQFATLDGILIAKEDNPAVNIGGAVVRVMKGERFILEIKSSAPQKLEYYREWKSMPVNYEYQAAAQMMCSGIDNHILYAELSGMFARDDDMRCFYHSRSDYEDKIAEIAASVPRFFNFIEKDMAPAQAVDLADAVITVNPTLGTITDNLEEFRTMVMLCAEKYKGLTFTADQCSEAKKMRAELNKAVKQINAKRISISKQWNEPYDAFKKKCDEICQIIKDVSDPIDEQIKAFEEAEENEKLSGITDYIKSCLDGDYKDLAPLFSATAKCIDKDSNILGVKKNAKWANKGFSMAAVQTELDTYFRNVRKEYQTLYDLKEAFGDFWNAIYAEYISSGLSLVSAINKKNQLTEARQAQLEMQRRQEEARAREEQKTPEPELPIEEPVPSPQPEEVKHQPQKNIYTKCVEFAHTDISEFNELIKFLVQHGFKFREIKDYKA